MGRWRMGRWKVMAWGMNRMEAEDSWFSCMNYLGFGSSLLDSDCGAF